jgi:hypothetical protein
MKTLTFLAALALASTVNAAGTAAKTHTAPAAEVAAPAMETANQDKKAVDTGKMAKKTAMKDMKKAATETTTPAATDAHAESAHKTTGH